MGVYYANCKAIVTQCLRIILNERLIRTEATPVLQEQIDPQLIFFLILWEENKKQS